MDDPLASSDDNVDPVEDSMATDDEQAPDPDEDVPTEEEEEEVAAASEENAPVEEDDNETIDPPAEDGDNDQPLDGEQDDLEAAGEDEGEAEGDEQPVEDDEAEEEEAMSPANEEEEHYEEDDEAPAEPDEPEAAASGDFGAAPVPAPRSSASGTMSRTSAASMARDSATAAAGLSNSSVARPSSSAAVRASADSMARTSTDSMAKTSAGSMARTSAGSTERTSAGSIGRTSAGSMGRTSAGSMGQTSTGSMGRTSAGSMGRASAGSVGKTSAESMGQTSAGSMGRASAGSVGKTSAESMGQTSAGSVGRTSAGSMGRTSAGSLGKTSVGSMGRGSAGSMGRPSTASRKESAGKVGSVSFEEVGADADESEDKSYEGDADSDAPAQDTVPSVVTEETSDLIASDDTTPMTTDSSSDPPMPLSNTPPASTKPPASLGVPGQPGVNTGGEQGENAFAWLRRISTQMDDMGITDELKKKYGDGKPPVILEGRPIGSSSGQDTSDSCRPEDPLAENDLPATNTSSTQTAVLADAFASPSPPSAPPVAGYGASPGPPVGGYGAAPAPPTAGYGAAQAPGMPGDNYGGPGGGGGGVGGYRDDRGYSRGGPGGYRDDQDDRQRDAYERGYKDGREGKPFRGGKDSRGGRDGRRGDADKDRPCGQCRCCIAMRRVVSYGDEDTLDSQSCVSDSEQSCGDCGGKRGRNGSPCRSLSDLLDGSSMTVSTGTSPSCDDEEEGKHTRSTTRWLKNVTDDFMRSQCIRQLVLKNDFVGPGRVRSKMTRVMRCPPQQPPGNCTSKNRRQEQKLDEKARGDSRKRRESRASTRVGDGPCTRACSPMSRPLSARDKRPALSPLRMSTRLLDGREINRDVPCTPTNPTRQFIDTYLERTANATAKKSGGKRCAKGSKSSKKQITISTNLKG